MAGSADLIKILVTAMVPAREQFETGHFYGWRCVVASVALFSLGALAMLYALAFGFISLFGFTGFAQANEVSDVKASQAQLARQFDDKSNDIMGVVVGGQIFDLQFKRCAASKAGSMDLVRAYSDQLQGNLDQYYRLTKRAYNLQVCP